jgi:hypothetical protein
MLLTGVVVLLALYRLAKASYRREASVPLLANLVAQHAQAGPVEAERRQIMVQEGNLWEAARDLARQGFEDLGYGLNPEGLSPALPQILVVQSKGSVKGWPLRLAALRLWKLAYGNQPWRISRKEFQRLAAQMKEVQSAVTSGLLQIDSSDKVTG